MEGDGGQGGVGPQTQTHTQTLPTSPRTNPLVMLSRLTTALRIAKEEAKWDMAGPALERAEGVAEQLRARRGGEAMDTDSSNGGAEESMEMTNANANVVAALEGRFPYPFPEPGQGHGAREEAGQHAHAYSHPHPPMEYDSGRNGYASHPAPRDEAGEYPQTQTQPQAQSPSYPRDQGEYPPGPATGTGHWQGHYAGPYGHPYHAQDHHAHPGQGGHGHGASQYRGDEGHGHGHGHGGYPASHARMVPPQGFGNNPNPGENAAWGVDMAAFSQYGDQWAPGPGTPGRRG